MKLSLKKQLKFICSGFPTTLLVTTRAISTNNLPAPAGVVSSSKILTETGYKAVEELTLTDKVLTKAGTFKPIKEISKIEYSGDLCQLKVKYHSAYAITCTPNQLFYVRTKENDVFSEPTYKQACDLTENDYYGMVINTESIIPEFSVELKKRKPKPPLKLDNPDMWWVLGYFMGDGWIMDTKKKDGRLYYDITFVISNRDEHFILPRIQKILPISFNKKKPGCKEFRCRNALWFSILKNFGKYAHGKKIPEFVQNAPIEFVKAFIEGFETADGYFQKDSDYGGITTVSVNLTFGLQRLYLKLGRVCGITKSARAGDAIIKGVPCKRRDSYQIRGLKTRQSIFTFKDNQYFIWYKTFKIEKIQKNETILIFSLKLENENSFILENLILFDSSKVTFHENSVVDFS